MKKKIIIIACLVLLCIGGVFAGIKIKNYLPFYFDKMGIKQPDTEYTLTIDKTDFENEVAIKLRDNGIIVSATRFLGYLHENHPDFVWLNGNYNVSADMSYKELCEKLKTPDSRIDYVKFTVPEGKTVLEIADIVEKSGLCTAAEFLKAADSYDYDYDFVKELKARKNIAFKLEGYLFPATYEFRRDTVTPETIVDKMLSTFDTYVTDEMIQKAKDKGLTLNELVSFGAVIQAEAFSKDSMKNISSVFWNRLNTNGMRMLQSDPTMFYADDLKNVSDEVKNAYNTYKCVGLPVGPTNSPGLDVIEAVLDPNDTDYFYFVTDADGNFYYNKTYAAHVNTCYDIGLWKR